jgi:hypothetical protein
MTLPDFQVFVGAHPDCFAGVHPHSAGGLDRLEQALGYRLPETLRWLLENQGYSDCCGVDNIEEAVEQTLSCRRSIALPLNWLILNDWGDGGIVLLDLPTGRVCWCGSHNAANLSTGQIDSDADWFTGYPEWVAGRVEAATGSS